MKNSWIRRALAVPAALLIVSLIVAASARAQAPVDDSKTVVKSEQDHGQFLHDRRPRRHDRRAGRAARDVHGGHAIRSAHRPDRGGNQENFAEPDSSFVVNTHVHPDHTGGNANMGKMGATIFARDELRDRLMNPNPGANGQPGTPYAGGRASGRHL